MIPDRSHIQTEQANPESLNLDALSIEEGVALFHRQDQQMVESIGRQQAAIAMAVRLVATALAGGGRLVYFGAGTSGRLGVLDASECPPTFCTDPAMVVGIIAGGDQALRKSIENVEDDADEGARQAEALNLGPQDVAFGIAAGGTTPFVHGALRAAKARGAKTIFLICTRPEHVTLQPDLFIPLEVGPEIITGSTRLKAGSATKLVLNTITTMAMVQLGKTYGNLMVDIDALKNAKLIDRAARIISLLTGLKRPAALELLQQAGGKVKRALIMHHRRCDQAQADRLLQAAGGRLREILGPPTSRP